ncbi:Disease resistance RPP13-like protein [Actinidia chinensis var. chinensis]|uniref:Disease resistance RPP13-like protein n=1 Tax=Actinidia chinensis var. chinensis TaxID=1590841 RepID=A0A2R6QQ66_ACTCC|nr:Disease resistance RPP13-like protein [Actinidia chinensis var. chinensis]
MAAVGEIFLGAFLQVVFDKLASLEILYFFRRESIRTQLRDWETTLREIRAVLDDAEEKQITNKHVNLWLEELQDLTYDLDDLLDVFSTEALHYKLIEKSQSSTKKIKAHFRNFMCLNPSDVIFDSKKSKVNKITTKLQDMYKQISTLGLHVDNISRTPIQDRERRPTTSKTYERCIYGRDESKRKIINLLLREESDLGIIPITGMGGIGKTTLVQVVYNGEVVEKHFDLKAWICVSDNFDITRITKEIAGYVHVDSSGSKTLDQLQDQLKNALVGKKFLIVLDDVWEINYNDWNILKIPFSDGVPGCKVIVTTRDTEVASMMGTVKYHALECLPHEECWSIFEQHAFRNISTNTNPKFESIGQEIVKKCGGLPLAARTLGGLLQCKTREIEWEHVLESKIWELKGSDILPALRLSYHHLPPHLKQCFVYCAILPKDYEFEEEELVLMWMAEGFICQQEGGKKMEDLGGEYFRDLLSRSFFQPSCMTEGSKFVMHDLINDLAQFFARQTCFRLEDKNQEQHKNKNLKKTRHSSYTQGSLDGIKKFKNFYKAGHLRTFLPFSLTKLPGNNLTSHVPLELLPKMKCLRVLSFSRYRIHELPSIGELKHLRYLNLSYTLIKRLPESLRDLYNMQTLLLTGCERLEKFPQSIENLINLRHLDITAADSLEEMPLGIGELESLQKLSNFIITRDKGFRIRELGNLINLGGKLEITGLHNVVDPLDAVWAYLNAKKNLDVLSLVWSKGSEDLRNEGVETDVINVLRPHSNLKELHISFYHGSRFPTWIGDQRFSNMVSISLRGCENCSSLPPLGQLRSLKKLFVERISNVKQVGNEFYGKGCSKPFPVLEILIFENIPGWEDWYPYVGETEVRAFTCLIELSIKGCPKLLGTLPNDLPCLRTLKIEKCPKLLLDIPNLVLTSITTISMEEVPCPSLPWLLETRNKLELSSLKSLDIRDVSIPDTLRDLSVADEVEFANVASKHMSSLTSLNFRNIQNLRFLPKWFSEGLSGVESLKIKDCNELTTLWKNVVTLEHCLPVLRSLQIWGCPQLISLFEEEKERQQQQQLKGSSFMMSLESLTLQLCGKLEKLPKWLHTLPFLGELNIYSCPSLVSFPEKGLPSTLRKLEISACGALESLPEWMPHTNYNLEVLEIFDCPALKYIISPRGGLPPSLKKIKISYCAMLESLVAEEGMEINCPSLESFEIRSCKNLKFLPDALDGNNLRRFVIQKLDYLESIPEGWFSLPTNLREIRIFNEKLDALPHSLQNNNFLSLEVWSSLKSLDIRDVSIPDTLRDLSVADEVEFANVASKHMSSLTSLNFRNIQNLRFLPKWFSEGLSGVESLKIKDCNELTTLWKNVVTLEHCLPVLRSLQIWGCPQLISLFEEEKERQQQQQLKGSSFMMSLESLTLQLCGKLEKLPKWLHTLPFLGELNIYSCPSLVSFPEKGLPSTLRKLEISACGALESLPEWMPHTNYNLEVLEIFDCPALKYIISPRGGLPPSLKKIKISYCAMLESLVAEEGMEINCPSLESFEIRSCKNLKFLPDALDGNNLRRFVIQKLDYLESIPEGWFSLPTNLREIRIFNEKLDALPHSLQNNNFLSLEVLEVTSLRPSILKKISFDRFSSLTNLIIQDPIREEEDVEFSVFPIEGMSLPTSLIQLDLGGFPYLKTLCSMEFQKLTSLQELYISMCPRLASIPKEGLPPSLQRLTIDRCAAFTSIPEQVLPQSLLKLTIRYCPKFGSFPEQGLPQSLLELYVQECPILKRQCTKDKGKYWRLIRHIPVVEIDKRSIFDIGEEE